MDYDSFVPGRNIWKTVPRFFFMSFQRIGILGAVLLGTMMIVKRVFPYNIGWFGLIFIVNNILFGVFLILRAPSKPGALMIQEIGRAIFKPQLFATVDIEAITHQNLKEKLWD